MERPQDKVEFYTKLDNANGYYVAYERSPIPGVNDIPVLSRESAKDALEAAVKYVDNHGSCFKSERAVV
jgi:hypothetical protein